MRTEEKTILRGWMSTLTMPFVLMFMFGVQLPFLVARKIWRWHRLPLNERQAIRARDREKLEGDWEGVDQAIKAALLFYGLPDTPANRAKLSSRNIKRRRP